MISEEIQQAVLDLLRMSRPVGKRKKRRKYSQRTIAKLAGVSRGSVATIKQRGEVRLAGKQMSYPKAGTPPKIVRCERCETMALADWPCGECKLRRLHKRILPVGHSPSDIAIELRPAEQRRHAEILAWRAGQPVPGPDLP